MDQSCIDGDDDWRSGTRENMDLGCRVSLELEESEPRRSSRNRAGAGRLMLETASRPRESNRSQRCQHRSEAKDRLLAINKHTKRSHRQKGGATWNKENASGWKRFGLGEQQKIRKSQARACPQDTPTHRHPVTPHKQRDQRSLTTKAKKNARNGMKRRDKGRQDEDPAGRYTQARVADFAGI